MYFSSAYGELKHVEILSMEQKSRGNFFQIDPVMLGVAARLGMGPLVAYLVVARGTARDNRRSSWSVNAIEKKTGLGRVRAATAIRKLIAGNVLECLKGGTKPVYRLLLTAEPKWIWLPNAFIDGVGCEVPPIEKLRRWQDPNRLEFVVRLYGMQNLPEAGGIHWSVLQRSYRRRKIWNHGIYNVWGFDEESRTYSIDSAVGALVARFGWTSEHFWEFWTELEEIGLIEPATYVVESLDADAGIVFPFDPSICSEVHREAAVLAEEILMRTVAAPSIEDHCAIIAVEQFYPCAQLVDVYRLRYRPKTAMTAAWIASNEGYRQIANKMEVARSRLK